MSGDESSSSEDLPLSALATNKRSESSDEAEFDNEDEDEEMDAEAEEQDSSDFIDDDDGGGENDDDDYASDSSDDAPLSSLKSAKNTAPPKKATKVKAKAKKATPKKKAASAKKKKGTTTKKSPKAKQSSSASTGNWLCASGELYAQCDKGKLIQSILARWWYAYQWPDLAALPAYTPTGYDALDGFPGVYICTQGGNVGKFLDKRDHTRAPSFQNFARKSSAELKETLLKAIEEQLKVLIEHEGKGTTTEKELRVLKTWAGKLNCSKADKQAEKVLKAKRLVLT